MPTPRMITDMSGWTLDTPVAFFVFNRPEKTRRVAEQIAAAGPPRVLVIADGPREGHSTDTDRCERTRAVIDEIDWRCTVKRNYADENLGLYERFSTGLEWVFTNEDRAVILEDDCLPNESFFRFCDTMLERYRDDERIMDITGTNHLGTWKDGQQDYHFSYQGSIWGWATWHRSWEWYDPEMQLWSEPEVRQQLRDVIANDQHADYLAYIYQQTFENLDTWDYQWGFARQINSALSIVPSRNLISNIGFDETATNTTDTDSELADGQQYSLEPPYTRPDCVGVDRTHDERLHRMRPISHRNRLLRAGRRLYDRGTDYFGW